MTKLISHSKSFKSNFVFTDFFENQDINIALLMHNINDKPFLKQLNVDILNKVLNLRLENIENDKIEDALKEFFVTLNWQINAIFKKSSPEDDGISLLLIIVKNHKIFMVQFGRILAAVIEHSEFKEFGRSWKNFRVKNRKELNLLGYESKNINVKIYKKDIEKMGKFVAVSSDFAEKTDLPSIPQKDLQEILKRSYKEQKFTYILFDTMPAQILPKHKQALNSRIRISLYIMIAIILISTGYVYFGKNWLQNTQKKLKEKNSAFIKNELMEKLLEKQDQVQEILDQIFSGKIEMKLFGNHKISIKEVWTQDFDEPITTKPFFDIKQFYIVQKNKLSAISRINKKTHWNIDFDAAINYIEMLEANRILVVTNNSISCVSRNSGKILWKKISTSDLSNKEVSSTMLIVLNEFNKFDSGIILTVEKKKLTILNKFTGEVIASYNFKENIRYISDYDNIFDSLYVVTGNSITKILIFIEM